MGKVAEEMTAEREIRRRKKRGTKATRKRRTKKKRKIAREKEAVHHHPDIDIEIPQIELLRRKSRNRLKLTVEEMMKPSQVKSSETNSTN